MEIRAKKEAIQLLSDNEIAVGKNVNYVKRQDSKAVFWLNPKISSPEKDWTLILNNQYENELISIPTGTFKMKTNDQSGLVPRHDIPDRIDLEILSDSLIDQRSKCDFGKCNVKRIKY